MRAKRRARLAAGTPPGVSDLEESHPSGDRCDQLRGVVGHPLLEHELHLLDVPDLLRWIAAEHHEVGLLSRRDGTDAVGASEVGRAIQGADADRLERREAAPDEE